MLTHRGFSAWITVDGEPAPEYLMAVDHELNRVSCWIPGEEGRTFAVSWRDHGGKVDTCAFLTLDGITVPGRFLFGEGVATREGVRASRNTERPFVFQKIVEVGDSPDPAESVREIGMITLRIKRIARVGSRSANSIQDLPQAVLGKRKAGDLFVGFGEETKVYDQYPSTWVLKPYDEGSCAKYPSTYVSFVFRYRSREFLESQGICNAQDRPLVSKRPSVRRVVSLPPNMTGTPAPSFISPPKKKARLSSNLPSALKSHTNPSLRARRTASCRATHIKSECFPGQGLIVFEEAETAKLSSDSGSSSTDLAGVSQSTGAD